MATTRELYLAAPFDEAVSFFRQKLNMPSRRWDDLWKAQHAKGFMVAGAMKAELLADLRTAVNAAIVDGESLQDFRARFDSIVEKHGWKAKGNRNWRTKVIYNTNMRTAYMAGRWEQMTHPDVVALRPYLQYRHGDSRHPRPHHLAWDKLVLRHDDPWWDTHYTPNGWGCRCRVISLSQRDMESRGLTPGTAPDDGTYQWKDKAGNTHTIPVGIDPGWDYNVGKASGQSFRNLSDKFETLPNDIARKWMGDFVTEPAFKMFIAGELKGDFPVAVLDDAARTAIGAESQVAWLSADSLSKNKGEQPLRSKGHPELTLEDYQLLPEVIGSPELLIEKQGTREVFVRRHGVFYMAVLKTTQDKQQLYVLSFRKTTLADVEREKKLGNIIFDRL